MSDNKNIRGPHDSSRVNVNEHYELRYWTERFNVSEERLKNIVGKVGPSVKAVEEYLKDNYSNPR